MENLADIEVLIDKHGLNHIKSNILNSIKPSISLRLDEMKNGLSPGESRIGGVPDLPSAALWPSFGRFSLAFIGQINLEELSSYPAATELPKQGLLSFFYDVDRMPWGFGTHEQPWWKVLYFPDNRGLKAINGPENGTLPKSLPEFGISFVPSITVPAFRSIEIDQLLLTDDDFDLYRSFRDELIGDDETGRVHRMFGHPDAIQGCMQRTVQFASRDEQLPKDVYSYYEHPRAKELIPGSFDWRLLLQVDSDERLELMWGDAGRIYFWIHKDDLAKCNFEKSWLFLQCY